ncbi:pleckstrin homology domain-containing family G member 3-like isoform X2 [Sycon ciliatum]|uniref:pleckstrin homology domain-containing family G member 3-like isoform X2 n=1 Tax=Sycon ciliatum TaxID=27933 RepID=UPI0031F6D5E5
MATSASRAQPMTTRSTLAAGSANKQPSGNGPILNSVERRKHIIREIRESEESYVEKLNLIVTLFWGPLHVNPILDKSEMDAIFSNIVELRRINLELLDSLREHRSNPGLAFTRMAPFLKFYALYAENFNRAMSTLQECVLRNSEFSGFKTSQESRPSCQALRLEGFLIMPIQRIPRYRLLLKDLLRHTDETHPDFPMLKTSYDQICEVASHINEYIRQHENFEKMLSIQQSLSGAGDYRILMPGRRFVKEGRLMKVCRKKSKERVIFLFSDQLVYAKPRARLQGARKDSVSGTHIFRAALPLVTCSVTALSHHPRVPSVSPLLMIECQSSSLILFSSDASEHDSWLKALQESIRHLRQAHESLVHQMSRRDSRSVILTNTMLKGSHRVKGHRHDSSESLLEESPTSIKSDYPLRYSVMSHQADEGEDDEESGAHQKAQHGTAEANTATLPLDLTTSQDVDDLLHALASIDSIDNEEEDSGRSDNEKPSYTEVRRRQLDSSGAAGTAAGVSPGANGVDANVHSTRPVSMKPTEKFSRDGIMSPHQLSPTVSSASAAAAAPAATRDPSTQAPTTAGVIGVSPGMAISSSSASPHQSDPESIRHQQQQLQQQRLGGQGPSFRRRPPTKEMRGKYARDAAAASLKEESSHATEQVMTKSHTLDRSTSRKGDGGQSGGQSGGSHGNGGTGHKSRSMSLDRRRVEPTSPGHTISGTSASSSPARRQDQSAQSTGAHTHESSSARVAKPGRMTQEANADGTAAEARSPSAARKHGYFDDSGQYHLASSSPEPEQTGTLRKKKQVRSAKQPLKVITSDSGQLMFVEGEAAGSGTEDGEGAAADDDDGGRHRACDDVEPLLNKNHQVRGTSTRASPSSESREGSNESSAQKHPPGEDPVTDLGCGGLRTTTYSFETATAESRVCRIL